MDTDAVEALKVPRRPPVPPMSLARQNVDNEPHLVDDAGIKKWSNNMLKGLPGGRASTWEQWGN